MFQKTESGQQVGGAGGATTYASFLKTDQVWDSIKNMKTGKEAGQPPQFVSLTPNSQIENVEFDVIVCGGTLGIFLGCALQSAGLEVAVVERGQLSGREQEWNISRFELDELIHENVLSQQEVEDSINIKFNPIRAGFFGCKEVWTEDVLNLGVSPQKLITYAKSKFEKLGGALFERCQVTGVQVCKNGIILNGDNQKQISAKLLIDSMGHRSPIVQQVRWGKKPDGICIVVGCMGRGFKENQTADIIYTNADIVNVNNQEKQLQYFWEAFPAGSHPEDRTTYMFSYLDAEPYRPSLQDIMEDYWQLMPKYQNVSLDEIQPRRILYGMFPTFRDSPLQIHYPRILPVGDASGIQSPLSFGGFGALTRHLSRLRKSIVEAIEVNALSADNLSLINAYNPGLSQAWMLQRAMSVRQGQNIPEDLINRILGDNFISMQGYGDAVLKPFLQDVTQFYPLFITLVGQVSRDPGSIPNILTHVGFEAIADWTKHFVALGIYTVSYGLVLPLSPIFENITDGVPKYRFHRLIDMLKYGSGKDYSN